MRQARRLEAGDHSERASTDVGNGRFTFLSAQLAELSIRRYRKGLAGREAHGGNLWRQLGAPDDPGP
jgi:hypothetical protein